MILRELDEVGEITFVMAGRYDLGYELNNRKNYSLQFKSKTQIGAYNVFFKVRSESLIRAATNMRCFTYRKENWKVLMSNFPEFEKQLIVKIHDHYEHRIRQPLEAKKREHIEQLEKRKDYQQMLVLNEQKADRVFRLTRFREIIESNKAIIFAKEHQEQLELHSLLRIVDKKLNTLTTELEKVMHHGQHLTSNMIEEKAERIRTRRLEDY